MLDQIVSEARQSGAKVLLVGDWAQLSAVEAGGAFAMLVRDRDRDQVPELVDIRRFTQPWEKQASLGLRAGDPAAIDTYTGHDRVHEGDRNGVLNQAYTAWLTDQQAGKQSLLLAADADTVTDLNARAHIDLVATGQVAPGGVSLASGTHAAAGDRIVTRRNDRTLTTGRGWVKNGGHWTVHHADTDGALVVQRVGGSKKITLPAQYVRAHVELGYATTAHRAQGQTVDTAHTIVTGRGMTREALYVAATRARECNQLYVAIDDTFDLESSYGLGDYPTARDVLTAVLNNPGTELSAHETLVQAVVLAERSVRLRGARPAVAERSSLERDYAPSDPSVAEPAPPTDDIGR